MKKLKYSRAISEINDAYFNLGKATFDTSIYTYNDTLNAVVWRQWPGNYGESRAVMGSKIDIWLKLEPDLLLPPDTINTDTN